MWQKSDQNFVLALMSDVADMRLTNVPTEIKIASQMKLKIR